MNQKVQADQTMVPYPHKAWSKWLAKAPLLLMRMGLMPLLGRIMIVMTHTGRKSGIARHTMTEFHMAKNGQIYVPCAFGAKAQWYQNMVANPHVTIQTAYGTLHALARRVTDDAEIADVYRLISKHNGMMVDAYVKSMGVEPTVESVVAHKDRLYFITFDATDEPTPAPLAEDLKWVWLPLVVLIGLIAIVLRGN